ncbi:MAG TPA: peptidylprolyl isomerase [Acidobacteriaceae bacterium]|nr:peptidylprolyl isomerase [Acidobacteriaceae bacterium]
MMLPFLFCLLLGFPLGHHTAPNLYRVRVDTTAGSFVIEVHRDWAPHGADRFYELVRDGYYNNSRFFRVDPGRWVQFGIAGDPQVAQRWRHRVIPDDKMVEPNAAGYVAFANRGPNTRSTEVYINTGDNTRHNLGNGFAPFGRVVEGMDTVERLYGGYGEHSGGGMRAGHQDAMFSGGNAWLDQNFPRLDKLIRARVVPVPRGS